jgi:hypothetical protein
MAVTKDDLQGMITDVTTFLKDLDKVIPNKVDEELISFLDGINNHPWLADLLLGSISAAKAIESKLGSRK